MTVMVSRDRIIVIGAGVAGLCAAITLSADGHDVLIVEKEPVPGGKMRHVAIGDSTVDVGPTVFTMKWVFDDILAKARTCLEDHLQLHQASCLARHFWPGGAQLDLYSGIDQSTDAISTFSDQENAEGYRRFASDSAVVFEALKESYISASRPNPAQLMTRIASGGIGRMSSLRPFSSLWSALGGYFSDPRLRQLFGRYATYCGSSPFAAPATLMLVAHVERDGVWMVNGGMSALALALESIAKSQGAQFRYGAAVEGIETDTNGVTAVRLETGERLAAGSVIFNGDVAALAAGHLGQLAAGLQMPRPAHRSLSAVTFAMRGTVGDFPLAHHTVLFSDDYKAEFDQIFSGRRVPDRPTVYICAQSRTDDGSVEKKAKSSGEPLFLLINAPADGDMQNFSESEIEQWTANMYSQLARCGLEIEQIETQRVTATPSTFNQMFPGTGGALYGRASHGWMASFQRPGARTKIPGLYLAGGSVHPGPGVPMAAISGRLAADTLASDRASMRWCRPAVTSGGMPTA